jgi:hypothetical protein
MKQQSRPRLECPSEEVNSILDRAIDKDQAILICAELIKQGLLGIEKRDPAEMIAFADAVIRCADENSRLVVSLFQ